MFDLRLYRAGLLVVLATVFVAAFSLTDRPRPIGTTLAADTFSGSRALESLDRLAAQFPDRRPGSAADRALASAIARDLRRSVPGPVREQEFEAQTVDGSRELVNVVATRPGAPGPSIVVVAHRDAAAQGSRADLSGTAALLELAHVAGAGRLQRTVTFVSTSGGSGGHAGAIEAARTLDRPVDAVIVLGAVGAVGLYRPVVSGVSNGSQQAPMQLQRTVQSAIREETSLAADVPRAFIQGLRMAAPMTLSGQGAFIRAGLPAVLVSATGERVPDPAAPVSEDRLERFGRGVLRALYSLDNGPDISADGPTQDLVLRGKVVPGWAVRMFVLALLLAPLAVAFDALVRVKRRGEPLWRWVVWASAAAAALALVCVAAVVLARVGLISKAPPGPSATSALEPGVGGAVAAFVLLLVGALAWVGLRPPVFQAVGLCPEDSPDPPAAAAIVAAAAPVAALLMWIDNPYAAGAMAVAAHLWLVAVSPGTRLGRPVQLGLIVAGLVPPLIAIVVSAQVLAVPVLDLPWFWTLLVAGGHVSWWTWTLWSVFYGAAVSAGLMAIRRSRRREEDQPITVRGPVTYAGPGSLGGTRSARSVLHR